MYLTSFEPFIKEACSRQPQELDATETPPTTCELANHPRSGNRCLQRATLFNTRQSSNSEQREIHSLASLFKERHQSRALFFAVNLIFKEDIINLHLSYAPLIGSRET